MSGGCVGRNAAGAKGKALGLHRIARSLRLLLLAAGVLLLIWLPVSFFVMSYMQVGWKSISTRDGRIFLTEITTREVERSYFPILEPEDATAQGSPPATPLPEPEPIFPVIRTFYCQYTGIDLQKIRPMDAVLPSFKRVPSTFELVLPLWIPAAVCFAWPMSSFIARRRNARRGFPVELEGGR